MTTPRLFLGVFALALLLPLLLLACGGSDEPTDGPSSGRATDEPVPATAIAPPAASGSAETDRETMVALYNATDGESRLALCLLPALPGPQPLQADPALGYQPCLRSIPARLVAAAVGFLQATPGDPLMLAPVLFVQSRYGGCLIIS